MEQVNFMPSKYHFDINDLEATVCDTKMYNNVRIENEDKVQSNIKYTKFKHILGNCCTGISITNCSNVSRLKIKCGKRVLYDLDISDDFKTYPIFIHAKQFPDLEFETTLKDPNDITSTIRLDSGILKFKDLQAVQANEYRFQTIEMDVKPKKWYQFW